MFGILKRAGKIYTIPLDNHGADTLLPIIRETVVPAWMVYTDGFKSSDVLDVSEFKHRRIDHGKGLALATARELVGKPNRAKHLNGIENFQSQAKRVLRKYKGIPKQNFHLFSKECESRFNYGSPGQQLRTLKRGLRLEGIV